MEEAREINDVMPDRLAYKTIRSLNKTGNLPKNSEILLLGRSFKPDVRDATNSPYFSIKRSLEEFEVTVSSYDPYFPDKSTYSSPYTNVDGVVLITGHSEFCNLRLNEMAQESLDVFVDGRAIYDAETIEQHDIFYTRFGY